MSLPSLRYLNLAFNNLSHDAFESIAQLVSSSKHLIDLDLSFTGTPKEGDMIELVQVIKGSRSLQALHLNGLSIPEGAMIKIREILNINKQQNKRRIDNDENVYISANTCPGDR